MVAARHTQGYAARPSLLVGELPDEGVIGSNHDLQGKVSHRVDRGFLGISPDYEVHINRELLDEVDGPMLKHGLQEMAGRQLHVPERRTHRPDKDRLDERFGKFLGA